MKLIVNLLINGFAVFIASSILPGVDVNSFTTAIIVSVILGVLNMILKPILVVLTLPITMITLGLFYFVVNGLIILLVSKFVPGFTVNGILTAIIFSLVLSIINWFFNFLSK